MGRKPGYVAALKKAKTPFEKLMLVRFGNLWLTAPDEALLASWWRSLEDLSTTNTPNEWTDASRLFAQFPEGTLDNTAVGVAIHFLALLTDAIQSRDGTRLRNLAMAVEVHPHGHDVVRTILATTFLPMMANPKPLFDSTNMTLAEIHALVTETVKVDKDLSVLAKQCKSLGIKWKPDALGSWKSARQ